MSHPACELAHGLHLLRLPEGFVGLGQFLRALGHSGFQRLLGVLDGLEQACVVDGDSCLSGKAHQ